MLSNRFLTVLASFVCFVLGDSSRKGGAFVKAAPCPCVPTSIVFAFDFQWGCNHPPQASDFTSSSKCSITGSPSNASIKKVIIQDLAAQEEVELDVQVVENDNYHNDASNNKLGKKTYTFRYDRSSKSPTVLFLDFHQTSSAKRAPVASIDLYYQTHSTDCYYSHNPVFWRDDIVYFLDVVSVGRVTDPYCTHSVDDDKTEAA